jgi:hypothetical protein
MAKEWANKDRYHPSNGVLEPRVQMPRAKASVRTVRAWGDRKAVGGAAAQATPVRPVQAWTGSREGFVLVQVRGLFLEVMVLVVVLESLQVVRLLSILPLEFTTGMGGVVALRRRGGMVHGLSFVVLVLLQAERGGSLRVVTVVVFVEVALVRKMVWFVLTLSYGPPWAHYLGGYQDRLLGGPLGLPDLRCTVPDGVKHKDYRGEVLG